MESRLIFFGTSRFALPTLAKLLESGFRPELVVTTPDAFRGKKQLLTPPPVKSKALELGLEVYQPADLKAPEVIAELKKRAPTVGVLVAYGKIVPKAVIDLFPKGILNVHPSLLPRWRGATPIQAAIRAGDEVTGVTVILIDEDVDHGPILGQRTVRIDASEDYRILHDRLAAEAAELLGEVLPQWLAGKISAKAQDPSKATFCQKLASDAGRIDWSRPAVDIDRQVRALNPEPGTYTWYRENDGSERMLKILKVGVASLFQAGVPAVPGVVFEYDSKLAVTCGNGAILLETVQPEGKKPMSGEEFLRGHKKLVSQILRY